MVVTCHVSHGRWAMCPVRHEDDFRRRPITGWDNWVDRAIEEAKERGEFDNLPGHGKPLRIESNPYAPELDLAHNVLKNADMAPRWIELNREIEAELAALDELRERTAARFATARAQTDASFETTPAPPDAPVRATRWLPPWPFRRRQAAVAPTVASKAPPNPAILAAERERVRARYLERAAAIDKKIREYHDALPPNLWHRQRIRLTPERAARDFDAACPPIASEEAQSAIMKSRVTDSQ
jgi:hypothetical protein